MPGTYDLRFEAAGYDPVVMSNVVVSSGNARNARVICSGDGGVSVFWTIANGMACSLLSATANPKLDSV